MFVTHRTPSTPSAAPGAEPVPADPIPSDVAEYIADVLAELREMAAASGQQPLTDLLDVARREAMREERRTA